MKHTPTPWIAQEAADGAWFIWNSNGGISTKDLIASCVGRINPEYRDAGQARADAAFIVRACNAHEAVTAELHRTAGELANIIRDGVLPEKEYLQRWFAGVTDALAQVQS